MRLRTRTFDAIRLAALRRNERRIRRTRRLTALLVGALFATTLAIAVHDARAHSAHPASAVLATR